MEGYRATGLTLIGLLLLASLAGCGGMVGAVHQADAFGPKKTYAVVSVVSNEKVGCSDLGGNPCNGGVLGMVNTLARKDAYSEDASQVLEMSYPKALQALRGSAHLKLASDVKGLRAYRATAEDPQPTGMLSAHYVVAKGYKYFDEASMAKLAKELKVDGVIKLTFSYSAARTGMQVAGIGGSHTAMTHVMAFAADKEGRRVWADAAQARSEKTVGTTSGVVDFPNLRPLFVDSTTRAVGKLMENFDSKVAKM